MRVRTYADEARAHKYVRVRARARDRGDVLRRPAVPAWTLPPYTLQCSIYGSYHAGTEESEIKVVAVKYILITVNLGIDKDIHIV